MLLVFGLYIFKKSKDNVGTFRSQNEYRLQKEYAKIYDNSVLKK